MVSSLKSQSRRLLNIGGVLAGFVIGQGALFVLSSVLLAKGRPELVGELGLALGTLSLGVWVLDLGGSYYLPRAHAQGELLIAIPAVIVGRLVVGIPIALTAIAALHLLGAEASFAARTILLGVAFSAPVWALNLSGALDASGQAGLAGVVGNLSTLFAVVYAFVAQNQTHVEPMWIALAFSAGLLLTVVIQFFLLSARYPMSLRLTLPTADQVMRFSRFGVGFALSQLPSQAYARLVILLVTAIAGAAVAGYYVYVKTMMNAFAQTAVAIRRVDYTNLVASLKSADHRFLSLIAGGRLVYLLAVVPPAGSLLLLSIDLDYGGYAPVIRLLPYFTVVFAIWILASNAGNVIVATGRMQAFVAWNIVSLLLGLVLVVALLPWLGVRGVAVAEVCMHLAQLLLYFRIYRQMVARRCEFVS